MEHQTIFNVKLDTKPRKWPVGDGLVFGQYDGLGISHDGQTMDKLPVEFFNHDLMQLNPQNETALIEFAWKWGLLFHPARFGSCGLGITREVSAAIAKTDALVVEHQRMRDESEECFNFGLLVSMDEMALSATHLQEAVKSLRAEIKGVSEGGHVKCKNMVNGRSVELKGIECLRIVNAGASATRLIECSKRRSEPNGWLDTHGLQYASYTLTNAICNQIIETVGSYADWQICRYCENPFKFQRDYKPKAATERKQGQTSYCCDKCRESYKNVKRGRSAIPFWWGKEKQDAFLKDNPKSRPPRQKPAKTAQ